MILSRKAMVSSLGSLGMMVALVGVPSLPAAAAAPQTLYVATSGSDASACTASAPCATIDHAVSVAPAGSTISVGPGTYTEQVTLTKPLTLEGQRGATIDASGKDNGVLVKGPGAAGSVVKGFVVKNANFEGILLMATNNVTVSSNVVTGNDQGMFAKKLTGECAPQGQVPGDCGEGLHLMGVTNSSIIGNVVTGNSGGILVTDEVGPTANNVIEYNDVVRNVYDCGITLAAHSPKGFVKGQLQPSVAGVYDNTIAHNVSIGNGTKTGGGAGILIAAAPPGGANYANTVEDNYMEGDAQAGVTLHSHAPSQYLNGNRIVDNTFYNDATSGGAKLTPGDQDAGVSNTAGIVIWSGVVPVENTVVSGNVFGDVHFGVWTKNVKNITLQNNVSGPNVAVPNQAN